jgi:mRNA interferase RelE/StbE
MTWRVSFEPQAEKELDRLDRPVAERIVRFLADCVATMSNPRDIGEALKGTKLGNLWKYRVGDYWIIADIRDRELCVLVVRIGNRREVYRR